MTETSPAAVSVARVEEEAPASDATHAPLAARVAVFAVTEPGWVSRRPG